MPVGHKPTINYYSIGKDSGKIRYKSKDGVVEEYDYIEGLLTSIRHVKDEYEGKEHYKYHFVLEDRAHTCTDILQVGEASSAARGILLSLISTPGTIGYIRIAPFLKDEDGHTFTNVWYEHEGQNITWDKNILAHVPKTQIIKHGSRELIDDDDRRLFFRKICKRIIREKLGGGLPEQSETIDESTGEIIEPPAGAGPKLYQPPAPTTGMESDPPTTTDEDLPF